MYFPGVIYLLMQMDEYEALSNLFKALSEPIRIRIFMLISQGEICVCEIQEVLNEPQSKVSRHLSYLKHSGIIEAKRVGRWMHYSVRKDMDPSIKAHIQFIRDRCSSFEIFEKDLQRLKELKRKKIC